MFRTYLISSLVLCTAAFCVMQYDPVIINSLNMTRETGDIRKALALSELFAHGVGATVALLLAFTLAPFARRRLVRVLWCVVVTHFLVDLMKHMTVRRRPQSFGNFPDDIWMTWHSNIGSSGEPGIWNTHFMLQSFPSGHAASVVSLALGLAWLFPRGRWVFLTLALFGCLQRVMFLAHWPSDVLFGAGLGCMIAGNIYTAPLSDVAFRWIEGPRKMLADVSA